MKALTLYQPYASLLACGAKIYETRSWATNYRGKIAIHAGKKSILSSVNQLVMKTLDAMINALPGDYRYRMSNENLPRGAVIATAELVGCYPIVEPARIEGMISTGKIIKPDMSVSVYGNELLFGDFTPGRYAWEFKNMTMLDTPISAKGRQRLWNWEEV